MNENNPDQFRLVLGGWPLCKKDASAIRDEVFVHEQNVPPELELDEHDAECIHVVAYDGDKPAGTGRLLPDGHIGRLAVRRPYRGQGLGSLILTSLVDEARRQGHLQVELAAQLHAQGFYAAHGFVAEGEVFLDAGIDHIMMRRVLTA